MNKKEWKQTLLRGQGRCIQAVRKEPARYERLVMWACSHEIAFDPQCEGSRAWFVYQLICCYPEPSLFLETVIQSIHHTPSNGSWKMLYLAELLYLFSLDGYEKAKTALWDTYEKLYTQLLMRKRMPKSTYPARDDFEMLCIVLADGKESVSRMAQDIGRLYRDGFSSRWYDFSWLYDSKIKRYRCSLEKMSKHNECIGAYLQGIKYFKDTDVWVHDKRLRQGIGLSLWLRNHADQTMLKPYVKAYVEQTDPNLRAAALQVFSRCPFHDDPQVIIDDAGSKHSMLKQAAYHALFNIRHPMARSFALKQLQLGDKDALYMLMKNYQDEDAFMLETFVKAMVVDQRDTNGWHSIHLALLDMEQDGCKIPVSLLKHIYETTYCSCCREDAIRQMGKRRLLDDVILKECLLDSNDEIQTYVKQMVKRRQNRIKSKEQDRKDCKGMQ